MDAWKSKGIYEHPAKHQKGVYGFVTRSTVGIYRLCVGGANMSCPPEWAAKIEHDEQEGDGKAFLIRYVPEDVWRKFLSRLALEGITAKEFFLKKIAEYIGER